MKIFRELYFRGEAAQLERFVDDIAQYANLEWRYGRENKPSSSWVYFDYLGRDVEPARVCIPASKHALLRKELKVTNIVPLHKDQLSVDEYNEVLEKFYNDIIVAYLESGCEIEISEPSADLFDPKTVITDIALTKLEAFCNLANKSTGASHPNDQERWFDFICQTVDDEKIFDAGTFADFLQDESYWGKKEDGFIGVMGSFAWDADHAYQLATEYENACMLLQYYKRTRG